MTDLALEYRTRLPESHFLPSRSQVRLFGAEAGTCKPLKSRGKMWGCLSLVGEGRGGGYGACRSKPSGLTATSHSRIYANERSFSLLSPAMPDSAAVVPSVDEPQGERRNRILDAAERCFVRAGFHRTTMQDVAAEAGMSPGNLYRYFPSKDAIVAGLSERDRARVAKDFDTFDTGDFMKSFAQLGRKHFEDEPRERAILCLEIWAEAARNPTFAKLCADFEQEVVRRLTDMLREAQDRGDI